MAKPKEPTKFDPTVGSTVDVGVDDAQVADATHYMKEVTCVAVMTPQGDPNNPSCVWGTPVVYWGLSSTAKTGQIEDAGLELALQVETIYPGQHGPEDFSGVLVPNSLTGVSIECSLDAVRRLNAIGRGIIFLDELSNATRATEGAMLGFVHKRRAGNLPIAPRVRILGAANPPKWSTNGYQMTGPTANRYCHFQVKCPPHRKWIQRMISGPPQNVQDPTVTEELVRARWREEYGHALALTTGYIEHQPMSLHHEPPPESPQSGYGWSSPKTWEQAARMYATAKILGYPQAVIELCLEGCLGPAMAFEFMSYVRNSDLPSPEHVLRKGWEPDVTRLDIAFAVLANATQYVLNTDDRQEAEELAVGLWNLFGKFVAQGLGDMIITSAKKLTDKNLSRKAGGEVQTAADPLIRWMVDNGIMRYAQEA